MNIWLARTLFLGLFPLGCGLIIFLSFSVYPHPYLVYAGFAMIALGFVMVLFGCWTGYMYVSSYPKTEVSRWRSRLRAFGVAGVLFMNFPAAALCCYGALMIFLSTTFVISNQSPVPLEDVQIFFESGTDIYAMGTIAPNRTLKKRWNFSLEGTVSYQFKMGDEIKKGELTWVYPRIGREARMNIDRHGDIQIMSRLIPYRPASNSGES